MKVLLFGHYGHGNFGDDLLMALVADQLKDNQAISLLAVGSTEDAEYIQRLCPYVESQSLADGLSALGKYDRVLFGGGGTVFDYRSGLGLGYAIRKRASDFRRYGLPKSLHGTRFASIGLGLGPFADDRGERSAMNRLRYHDFVYTRDQQSYEIASRHQLNHVTASHDICLFDSDAARQTRSGRGTTDGKPITFIVRDYKYGSDRNRYLDACLRAAEQLRSRGHTIRWVSFQMHHDRPVLRAITQQHGTVWVWDPRSMPIEEGYRILADSEAIVTARMHGTYVAGLLGVPAVSIALHPKLRFAADYFPNSAAVSSNPTSAEILNAISSVMTEGCRKEESRFAEIEQNLSRMFTRVNQWISSE